MDELNSVVVVKQLSSDEDVDILMKMNIKSDSISN